MMNILFLCTAHNSLSQRLFLALSRKHNVSIEFAIFDDQMIEATELAQPDLIVCPFLTTLVPKAIYDNYLTLIVHPGPPGDAGPSALDWLLIGDDGSIENASELLHVLDHGKAMLGRSHWGVTVLQADENLDAGPVWAWDQFPVDIDQPGLTKSELYRGPASQAAIASVLTAISRIQQAATSSSRNFAGSRQENALGLYTTGLHYPPSLVPDPEFGRRAVSDNETFQGGKLHHRLLLKAAERDIDPRRHAAHQVSRRIRSGDSQPGAQSKIFSQSLYLYGGIIEEAVDSFDQVPVGIGAATVLATRNEAICIGTADGKGVWITHIRRPKGKADRGLLPKVPATAGLVDLGIMNAAQVRLMNSALPPDFSRSRTSTFQEIWVDFCTDRAGHKIAYLYFDFYNGAMSTSQCAHLIRAFDYILTQHTQSSPIRALVCMGGSYFSNGIALNIAEAAADPAMETWQNINRIDDCVHYLLHEFPSCGILTVAAMRGNAAAGGVAMATACDFVISGSDIVLNPAYRAVGLHGSEYHTISYPGRCGKEIANHLLRAMLPLSPLQAQACGLIDFVFPSGPQLEECIRYHVSLLISNPDLKAGTWKHDLDLSSSALAKVRAEELGHFSKDCWSARSIRYHSRRHDLVRKVRPTQTPLRFATHRRITPMGAQYDEEELDSFDSIPNYEELFRSFAASNIETSEFREGLSKLVPKWGLQGAPVRDHRGSSVKLEATRAGMVKKALPRMERKDECLFACYYRPVVGAEVMDGPLTPPVSPSVEEGRCKMFA